MNVRSPQLCISLVANLLPLATLFLWVSLIGAILITAMALVERAIKAVQAATGKASLRSAESSGAGTFLDALKGLVESLTAAPAWFAIFVAGLALLWSVGHLVPEVCAAVGLPGTPPEGAGPAAPGDSAHR